MERKPDIGNSEYQKECRKYYNRSIRDLHSQIFTFDPKRINAEKTKDRYFNCNADGIRNLYSFIAILKSLLAHGKTVQGVDFGCGNHYFVNDLRNTYNWDVRGYDSDNYAIELAKRQYPSNSDYYIHCDLLKNKLPIPDNSQDFVFCNAVIQHFSDEETDYAFHEISRVLKLDGIFIIIFKRNIVDWFKFSEETGVKVKILDDFEGKILIEDKFMKEAIKKLSDELKKTLGNDLRKGLRLFHVYSIDTVQKIAKRHNLHIIYNLSHNNNKMDKAIFQYLSGKCVPTAAIIFKKV